MLVAGLAAIPALLVNVVASFLTRWTGVETWLAAPVLAVGAAMVTALIQALGSEAEPGGVDRPMTPPHPYQPIPQRRRGTPLGLALIIALVVIGGGGWALTLGIRYAVGYVTGNEAGVDRMVGEPRSGATNGLELTVESVVETDHFTIVGVAARNGSNAAATLPLSGNCLFQGGDGSTLEADSFRSKWSQELPPGSFQRSTIVFSGHLPTTVHKASLSFSTVFGPIVLEGGPGSLVVRGIRLG